jgi:hypothetical protein
LQVLDVREWKQYSLFEALGIRNYTNIEAISRDGNVCSFPGEIARSSAEICVSNTTSSRCRIDQWDGSGWP